MVTVMTAVHSVPIKKLQGGDPIWEQMRAETERAASQEPVLVSFLHATILHHDELECALSFHLANQLDSPTVPAMMLREIMLAAFSSDATLRSAIRDDLQAVLDRDSACQEYHLPAARFGHGIMLDHATGLVIGETAVVGNHVSILQSVTLGGTGKQDGDRHPKIGDGVLISAGAKILGNIIVGEGAKVGAGSVVLHDVPPHTTVAGVPAKVVGVPDSETPALDMDHALPESDW
jgi:serine O-acetyltransferase